VTVLFSFCTALILFAILRSFISDPGGKPSVAQKPQEMPKLIVLTEEKVQDTVKPIYVEPVKAELVEETPLPSPAAPIAEQKHVIKDKETLSSISKKYYGTETKWEKIWEANKSVIPNKNRIRPGITIAIPE